MNAALKAPAGEAVYNETYRKALAEVSGEPLGNDPEVLAACAIYT